MQWVSATTAGLPKMSPQTRLAVFRPTPGSLVSSSYRVRYDPAVFVAQHFGHCHNIPRFGFIQAAGMDDFPDLLGIGLAQTPQEKDNG